MQTSYPLRAAYLKSCYVKTVLSGWLTLVSASTVRGDQLLFDFDRRALSECWSAVGDVRAERRELAPHSPMLKDGPADHGIQITAGGISSVYTKSGRVPRDWSNFAQICMWLFRSEAESRRRPQVSLEIHIVESDRKSRFWRRVNVSHSGWKQFRLPLRWFRWGDGRIPRWGQIDRIGFHLREACELAIDSIAIVNLPGQSAYLSVGDLKETGFPDTMRRCRVIVDQNLTLLTDVKPLDARQLTTHLHKVRAAFLSDLPFAQRSQGVPTLLVFSSRNQYQAFVPRFAQRLNGSSTRPQSSGYTVQGISTSYWDPAFGTLRPVYTHEFIHGLVSRSLRLASRGGWLHEGFASYFQLKFHPQENVNHLIQTGLSDSNRRSPLRELCNGQRIYSSRYWQAMAVVHMLLKDGSYREGFPRLIERFQRQGSTDLDPQLMPIFNQDWLGFETSWKAFCRKHYPTDRKPVGKRGPSG